MVRGTTGIEECLAQGVNWFFSGLLSQSLSKNTSLFSAV